MVSKAVLFIIGNRIAQIVFNSLFSIGIIVGNIILIGCILSKRELRHNSKYILVLLLAIADFYTGVFVIPLWTHALVTHTIDYSCSTSNVLYGSAYVHLAISCLAIVSINLDYIFQNTMASYQGKIRNFLTLGLALFFLIGPLIVLFPIFVKGVSNDFAGSCFLALEVTYARAARILSYWAPVACIVFTTIVVMVINQRQKRQLMYQQYPGVPRQPSQSGIRQSNPADLILAASLTVALNFPIEILTVISCRLGDCDWYYMLALVFGYFSKAKALLLPFVWFVNRDFRNTVTGRLNPASNQPLLSQAPLYYTQPQILTTPVAQGVYQNNASQPVSTEKQW